MTVAEYNAAIANDVVTFHKSDRCAAAKTLGLDPCDCGALEDHRFLRVVLRVLYSETL
jgi:hypothetical protein